MTEEHSELISKDLDHRLEQNVNFVERILGMNVDLVKREFIFHEIHDIHGICFYTDGLVNTDQIETVLTSLVIESSKILEACEDTTLGPYFAANVMKNVMVNSSIKLVVKVQEVVDAILAGDAIVFLDRCEQGLCISARGWDTRSVSEPQTEQVVRGPRDGFTESIRTNTTLVRRRIRDPLFRLEAIQLGTKTKTDINIAYLEGTVKEGLVKEVKARLKKIEIDGILESGYIEELIDDAPLSPFTTIMSTERPDKVAAAILEGRVAIFIDNTPFVLIVPTFFWSFLQASDDYYSRYWVGSFFRFVRYIAFLISLILPSIYVMLVSFHQEMIPTSLALTIASGREVVPFPILLEALIMETAFELMREAGLRMPKPIGSAVSIVGSLVIGQAAVQAGIVSPFMVIIVATTGIAAFAIPNYAASFSVRLLRFPILIASGTMGLLGFAAAFTIIVIHALSLRSFGEPYMAPVTPFVPPDQKDIIIRIPWWKMNKRPALADGPLERQGEHQMPKPPEVSSPKKPLSVEEQSKHKQKDKRFWRRKRHEP